MPNETAAFAGADPVPERSHTAQAAHIRIDAPQAQDAADVHDLIRACPPLDTNSLYANLIQCTHFPATCAVARMNGKIVGWISGHRPPADMGTYFLWQVAVHPEARGQGLPRRMLSHILSRPEQAGIKRLQTSITRENEVSWALFRSVSAWLGAPMREVPWFDRDEHFAGRHASEFLVTIGPFVRPGNAI